MFYYILVFLSVVWIEKSTERNTLNTDAAPGKLHYQPVQQLLCSLLSQLLGRRIMMPMWASNDAMRIMEPEEWQLSMVVFTMPVVLQILFSYVLCQTHTHTYTDIHSDGLSDHVIRSRRRARSQFENEHVHSAACSWPLFFMEFLGCSETWEARPSCFQNVASQDGERAVCCKLTERSQSSMKNVQYTNLSLSISSYKQHHIF